MLITHERPTVGFEEYYYIKDVFELLGFPHLEDSDYPSCGVIALNEDCDKEGRCRAPFRHGFIFSLPS